MFRQYEKLMRLGKEETAGILQGKCFIQEKIDGANTSIWLEDGEICCGSRRRKLGDEDFNGFVEYAKNNIRVNAVCPGVIDTPMNERNLKKTKNKKELISKWKKITPLGRVASPYELAQTVLFLSSDMSSFITGVGLLVDGGRAAT